MKQSEIGVLGSFDEFKLIGKQWMLVTAGSKESFNTMTASWGGLGILWNKNVATIYIRPSRYTYNFIENCEHLTLSFLPEEHRAALMLCGRKSGRDCDKVTEAGLNPIELESGSITFSEAELVVECRKLFESKMCEDNFVDKSVFEQWYNPTDGEPHTIFILEIEKVYTR